MDEVRKEEIRPVNPRRRKKTKMQIFKESYLPVIIAGVALLFILVTIIGSIVQSSQRRKEAQLNEQLAAEQAVKEKEAQNAEADRLSLQINDLMEVYAYDQAEQVLSSFSGNMEEFPQLVAAADELTQTQQSLITWADPSQVLNLSFQLLIADPSRAFADENYGTSYNRNFITTDEFSLILQQLYDNGYVLVDLYDIVSDSDTGMTAKALYLPEGKKPLILTQTHVNYNTFMTDGDGDKLPDKDGAGFASKLIIDDNGELANEYIDSNGELHTGEYDLVPILNSFIAEHPDFSYRGARAVIAVTGYDGLFGYRTNPSAEQWLGQEAYAQEIAKAQEVAQALKDSGYRIACYTYENIAYGDIGAAAMQVDLKKWTDEVTPILGNVEIFAFAQISDIVQNGTLYTDAKYQALKDAGFRYYLGFSTDGALWADVQNEYFRQARILVTGSNLKYHSQWFSGILNAESVLSSLRGNIPQ